MAQVRARGRVELGRPHDRVEVARSGERARRALEPAHAERIERRERDPPVRRELASGDADHARRAAGDDRLAAHPRGVACADRGGRAARRRSRGRRRARRAAVRASARTCSMSPASTTASSGSPSCGVSVVPRRRRPSHGTAKLTRTASWGIVSAAPQPSPPSTTACTPLLNRIDGSARGSSSRRTRSSQGPLAFTTERARTTIASPSAAISAPSPGRSATTSA